MADLLDELERKALEWEQRVRDAVSRLPDPSPDDVAIIARYGGMSAEQVPGLLRILRMYTEAAEQRGRDLERADAIAFLRFDMSMDLTADDLEVGAHEGAAARHADAQAAMDAEEDDEVGAAARLKGGDDG